MTKSSDLSASAPVSLSAGARQIKKGIMHREHRNRIVILILIVLLIGLVYLNLTWGNSKYSFEEVLQALVGIGSKRALYAIRTLRVPRILAGILAGMAFGMAGSTLQKLFGNPLASPDIIGVTAGSSVAAVFAMLIMGMSGWPVSILAVICGIGTTMLIYVLAHGQGYSNSRLILIGIGAQAFLNALISWLLQLASEYNVGAAMRWITGSLNDVQFSSIPFMAVTTITCMIGLLLLNRRLEILQLSDQFATTLGARPSTTRLALILLAVALTAFATAVTGPIASVAFLSGPIATRLCKTGKTPPLVAALTGAVLVLGADWIGQYALGVRYPVGVITGILGAPYLLILLMQMQKKSG